MVSGRILVPSYSGREIGFDFEKPYKIKNGDVDCKINFYITSNALEYWSRKILGQSGIITNGLIQEFYKRNCERIKSMLISIFKKFVQRYNGFPSQYNLTEHLWVTFDTFFGIASCKNLSGDFKLIGIRFDVSHLDLPDSEIIGVIKHELLHFVAEEIHGQKNTISHIREIQHESALSIEENKQLMENLVRKTVAYCHRNSFDAEKIAQQIETSMDYFYKYASEKFHNLVSDSALCIIAMEINDMDFVNIWIRQDASIIDEFEKRLKEIDRIMSHIIDNETDEKRKNLLLDTLRLLQFIECFNGMPFFAIAYGILGENWTHKVKRGFFRIRRKDWHRNLSSKNIYDFKRVVVRHCDPMIAKAFLRFYDDYLDIIKAQAIHNNPKNPNIKQQIHNTGCIERSKKAFRTLNAEFSLLLNGLKKHE